MSQRTFVTGFKAFGAVVDNPSAKLAQASGRPFQTLEVAYRAVDDFLAGLDASTFDRLLMIGVASGRDRITPELLARNFIGKTLDVRGYAPEGLIDLKGETLLESTLWKAEIVSEVVAFIPHTRLSMDAGHYLCNYISYRALQHFPAKQVGFLHVPAEDKLPIEVQLDTLQRIFAIIERGSS
jgi:pyroglutamyl-peptidase